MDVAPSSRQRTLVIDCARITQYHAAPQQYCLFFVHLPPFFCDAIRIFECASLRNMTKA
jgi:hypothetical protein